MQMSTVGSRCTSLSWADAGSPPDRLSVLSNLLLFLAASIMKVGIGLGVAVMEGRG